MLGRSVGPGWDFCPLTLFLHCSLPEVPETIELEVRTSTASGLLVWQGEVSVGHPAWGLRLPSLLVAGEERKGVATAAGATETLCFPGRRRDSPAEARTSSVLGFRTGTSSSGGSWPLLSLPSPPLSFIGFPSGPIPSRIPPSPTPVLPPAHTLWGLCACSYQLGSGEARLVSEDPINDGEWHRVTALR